MPVYLCVMLALRTTTVYIHPYGLYLHYTNTCWFIKTLVINAMPYVTTFFMGKIVHL